MLHCLWAAKCRILALQHQAHGHAMLGDRAAADRLLDTASATTGRVDDGHLWGNARRRTPHYVEVQRATCYGRTGDPRGAAADRVGHAQQRPGRRGPDDGRRIRALNLSRNPLALT